MAAFSAVLSSLTGLLRGDVVDRKSESTAASRAFALVLLGLFLFSVAYYWGLVTAPEGDHDEFAIWTRAEIDHNPFKYFWGKWISESSFYRPLSSFVIWVTYKIWGPNSVYNRLFNLFFHGIAASLLFFLSYRLSGKRVLSLVIALFFIVTLASLNVAASGGDKANPFCAIAFLLFFLHVFARSSGTPLSKPYLFFLTVLGILSKEPGVVLAFLSLLALYFEDRKALFADLRVPAAFLGLAFLYLTWRWMFFSENGFHIPEESHIYLLGGWTKFTHLTRYQTFLVALENGVKHSVYVFFPSVHLDSYGEINLGPKPLTQGILSLCLFLFCFAALKGREKIFVLAALLSLGLVHYSYFRVRNNYLVQLPFFLTLVLALRTFASDPRKWRLTAFSVLLILSFVATVDYTNDSKRYRRGRLEVRNQELMAPSAPGRKYYHPNVFLKLGSPNP